MKIRYFPSKPRTRRICDLNRRASTARCCRISRRILLVVVSFYDDGARRRRRLQMRPDENDGGSCDDDDGLVGGGVTRMKLHLFADLTAVCQTRARGKQMSWPRDFMVSVHLRSDLNCMHQTSVSLLGSNFSGKYVHIQVYAILPPLKTAGAKTMQPQRGESLCKL